MIAFPVAAAEREAARELVRRQFGGRKPYRFGSEQAWVGFVGEGKVLLWAGAVVAVERVDGREVGAPDLSVAGVPVDVKTEHRNVPPRPHYWAYVAADQAEGGAATELVFLSFDSGRGVMWLMGGLPKREFLARAIRVAKGEVVPPSLRAPCDVCAVRYGWLEPPAAWLDRVVRAGVPAAYLGRRGP